jgi:hypothetical protein
MNSFRALASWTTAIVLAAAGVVSSGHAAETTIAVSTPMVAPEWAKLERRLLRESVPACREFAAKYYDARGEVRCVLRWGANDGPDDAFENFAGWPELHALGASDEIATIYLKTWEGMIRQYSAAKTTEVPAGRDGMYFREFSAQADWMHHGEGLRAFNMMGLSMTAAPSYQARVRSFAGLYMGEDPTAPNYDPQVRIIRSMQNGSKGPMLRKATPLDWVGDPFETKGFKLGHGESTYAEFLEHYREYGDVAGDHFINLVATTLPTNAFLLTHEDRYKAWLVGYMEAWLERMRQNGGVIPSHVGPDGKVGGDAPWWSGAYGWGFSPVNPVNGKREHRNRIPRAVVGFQNALLVTGDQKYVNAWRTMIDAVNANVRTVDGQKEYPTMYGADGWYGWQRTPWSVGALEIWYWSQRSADRSRAGKSDWIDFLEGKNADYPETALRKDLASVARKVEKFRADDSKPEYRLADNMMDGNPATTTALLQLMWGALPPGREGSLLNARVRYFDPVARRAGVPEDVGALVTEMSDQRTVLTLVNLSESSERTVLVQGGGYGEHRIDTVEQGGASTPIGMEVFTVKLAPKAGAKLTLTMKRYASVPTVAYPWERKKP